MVSSELINKRIKKITSNKNIVYTKQFLVYETKNIYSVEYVNNILKNRLEVDKKIKMDGCFIKRSQRYLLFTRDEQVCVECGMKASFWALQKDKGNDKYHLNLYGIDSLNRIKLFTKDHIIPKSKGGFNTLENYQIMCSKCNADKGSN